MRRAKDYQSGAAEGDGVRRAHKVMDGGQTTCSSKHCFKLPLLAVFLLLFLSSRQTMPPDSLLLPSLTHFPSCYINKFYCASVVWWSPSWIHTFSLFQKHLFLWLTLTCAIVGSSRSPSNFFLFQASTSPVWLVFSFTIKCLSKHHSLWIMIQFHKLTQRDWERWGGEHCHYCHQGKSVIGINMATVWW